MGNQYSLEQRYQLVSFNYVAIVMRRFDDCFCHFWSWEELLEFWRLKWLYEWNKDYGWQSVKCGRLCELLPKLISWSLRNVPGFSSACRGTGNGGKKPKLGTRNLHCGLALVLTIHVTLWQVIYFSKFQVPSVCKMGIIPAQIFSVVMGFKWDYICENASNLF